MDIKKIFFILTLGLVSCGQDKNQNWKTLDFGSFKLTTPETWKIVELKGIDSYVGGLTDGKDTLFFDYGWYCPSVGDEDFKTHKFAMDTVNGLLANIVIPNEDGKGSIGMSISHFKDEQDKFIIGGTNINATDTILQIFKSLKFPESDTTKNSILTLEKFVSNPTGSGKQLFTNNCSSCHMKDGFIVGPPLKTIKTKRTFEWTYKFLTDRKSMQNDKEFLKLTKGKEYHCMEFKTLTKKELQLIIDFLN
jgi:hypothetical protein